MKVILLLAALLGASQANFDTDEGYSIERDDSPMARLARDYMPHIRTREQLRQMEVQLRTNVNQYVDRMLVNSRTFFLENELDPMKLPDYIRTFKKKVLWITWHGELVINNGKLQDLSTIFRNGDVNLDYKNKVLILDANLGFKDLQFSYDFKAKFMGIGPKGYIDGSGCGIAIQFKMHVDLKKEKAGLDVFKIQHISILSAHIKGLGIIIDWIFDAVTDLVLVIFKGPIVKLIDTEADHVLSHVIANLDVGSLIP